MPHKDFDAARRAYAPEPLDPVTFTLAGERFTCLLDPSLGDTFEMIDAPGIATEDFDPENPADVKLIRKIAGYIQHMLPLEERPRWDKALYRVPVSEYPVILDISDYISEEVVNRPTVPPASSSSGRQESGPSSKNERAGASASS